MLKIQRRLFRTSRILARKDFYETLGVKSNVSEEEIRKAYLKLVKQYHPDVNSSSDAVQTFSEINEAHETLGDPVKREVYDSTGKSSNEQQNEENTYGKSQHKEKSHFDFLKLVWAENWEQMEKEHNQFWVINSQKTYIHKSSNLSFMPSEIKVDLEIDFMDATRGTTKVVTIQRNEICESCSGHHKSSVYQCPECNGEGLNFTTLAGMTTMIACNSCKGTGEIGVACATCLGPGEMLREIKETVVIPKGTDTGDIIVFEGKGNLKSNKKDRGDLKVLVTVRDHPLFQRKGSNIISTADITFTQALLGSEIIVQTLSGPQAVKIPKGFQKNCTAVIKGQGIHQLNSNQKGDHIVKFKIIWPGKLTGLQRAALLNYAAVETPVADDIIQI